MKYLDHLEEWLIIILMAAATLLIFVAVLHRYLSGVPYIQDYTLRVNLSWAQELCIFMFIWMAKIGAAYGVRTGIHVGVDVLINRLPDKTRRGFILFGLGSGAAFTAIVGTLGALLVYHSYQGGVTTADLELPSWIAYLIIPLGSYLMCFRFLQVAASFWQTGALPHHTHGRVEGLEDAEDINWFDMDDDLHAHDLQRHRVERFGEDKGEPKP
jgi:C4-dicarboxylate transporter DctQ subunit